LCSYNEGTLSGFNIYDIINDKYYISIIDLILLNDDRSLNNLSLFAAVGFKVDLKSLIFDASPHTF